MLGVHAQEFFVDQRAGGLLDLLLGRFGKLGLLGFQHGPHDRAIELHLLGDPLRDLIRPTWPAGRLMARPVATSVWPTSTRPSRAVDPGTTAASLANRS